MGYMLSAVWHMPFPVAHPPYEHALHMFFWLTPFPVFGLHRDFYVGGNRFL